MNNKKIFPVIDIAYIINNYHPWQDENEEKFYNDKRIIDLSTKFADAFVEWGFLYLVNHGISESDVQDSFQSAKSFFQLDVETKNSFSRKVIGLEGGYSSSNERFDKALPPDKKECLDFIPTSVFGEKLNSELPGFMHLHSCIFNKCEQLSRHVLRLINMVLPINDRNYMLNQHKFIGDIRKNPSLSRMLHYPSISAAVEDKQLRCGEHTDYGTITLLFQDDAGGLQVVNPEGEYVDATPIAGSIVVNCADMLEIWSSGKFKSTRHRVLIPKNLEQVRQSYVFFLQADNDSKAYCLDGSDKYEPVTSLEYINKKFKETYG